MMMTTPDPDIVQILENCGCAHHVMKFAGLTIEKLSLYTHDDLARILPPDVGQQLVQKIEEEVQKAKLQKVREEEDGQNDDEVEFLKVITKREKTRVTVQEGIIDDEDDDDDEVGQQSVRSQDQIIDDGTQIILPYCAMEETNPPNSAANLTTRQEESSDEDSDEPSQQIVMSPEDLAGGFQYLQWVKNAQVEILGDRGGVQKCERSHPHPAISKQWTDGLTRWGSHIRSLKMSKWTWNGLRAPCPWNLFKILTQCLFIKELSIEAKISIHTGGDVLQFPVNFRLSKLKVLRIHHDGDLAYSQQLKQILVAAHKLREIYFSYGSRQAINSLLTILADLQNDQLQSLLTLSIKSYSGGGCLTQFQMDKLAKVSAISLEELELGDGLWQDVEGSTIEELLHRFKSTLKKLTILGCFKGIQETKPTVHINFPSMANLEYLNLGGNYSYAPVHEDNLIDQPAKIRIGPGGRRIVERIPDLEVASFSVTLKFPLLPKLTTLELGNMFDVTDLHFSTFPRLSTFDVGSRWDLTVTFPSDESSRRASCPLVTRLQLPDGLDDPYFVQLIPKRFPNLACCLIYLPTVKVLRTFFSSMAGSNLTKLVLRTRFDFPSILDTCLLDRPTDVFPSQEEVEKLRLLKVYGRWREFVKFHKIQLPEANLASLEGEGLAGLRSLKKLKRLVLNHRPRTLRIPRGHLHWTDPNCQFTGEFIGFRKYPWSILCEILRNNLMENGLQDDCYLNYDVPFRTPTKPELMTNWFPVQTSSSFAGLVKDEV